MAGMQEQEFIWKNGELIPWKDATVHVLSHALHYGTAVFEGARCYETADGGSECFRLLEHMQRLERSANMIMMPLPYSAEELAEATIRLIKACGLSRAYIRPIAFRGYNMLGVNPSANPIEVAIAAWPWDSYLGPEAIEKGIDVEISSWRQRSPNATPGAIKSSASYLNSGLANMEAIGNGFGEAILLNEAGMVAEGSGENLFAVRRGVLTTPPLSDGVLEGLTRASLIELAHDLGYEVREASMVRSDLYVADEVFFSGSAAELTPISHIDRRQIGAGRRGPVTKQLQEAFFDIVQGKNSKYDKWLTRI
ncbi:MAG: branched-chain amino acid transaminase [Coriobacteriales bacterium]|jgi:branched-chain amino acid aminotransferase|nr:branched-chain amino acid transaminase [Coriobacteriales bacterium]